jgi:hypothetical protein
VFSSAHGLLRFEVVSLLGWWMLSSRMVWWPEVIDR